MKIVCPSCRAAVSAAQVDVGADFGMCTACERPFSLAATVDRGGSPEAFDLRRPPNGAWYEETPTGWRIGASVRSASAFFHVPFFCIWSVFSLGFLYGSQWIAGRFDWEYSLFGLPFLYGTVWLAGDALMSLGGKIIVTVDRDEGSVFAGIGSLGRTRRFRWSAVSSIDVREAGMINNFKQRAISLTGPSRLDFGALLSQPRRQYLLDGLRRLLAERNGGRRTSAVVR